jgi:hypothetical protein
MQNGWQTTHPYIFIFERIQTAAHGESAELWVRLDYKIFCTSSTLLFVVASPVVPPLSQSGEFRVSVTSRPSA